MTNFYGKLREQVGSDESEVSNVDADEVAKMVKDFDDLDADLFTAGLKNKTKKFTKNDDLKKPESDASSKDQMATTTSKAKKARFQDFDDDDLLGDLDDLLVSDPKPKELTTNLESESTIKSTQKVTESSPTNKSNTFEKSEGQKKSMSGRVKLDINNGSLDAVSNLVPQKSLELVTADKTVNFTKTNLFDQEPTNKKSNQSSGKNKDHVKFDDDLLEGMGLDDRSRQSKAKDDKLSAKKNLIDDLLGRTKSNSETKTVGYKDSETKNTSSSHEISKETDPAFGSYSPSISTASRQPRRPITKRNTSTIGDPLGIFSPPSTPHKNIGSPNHRNDRKFGDKDSASWLGLSSDLHSSPLHQSLSPDIGSPAKLATLMPEKPTSLKSDKVPEITIVNKSDKQLPFSSLQTIREQVPPVTSVSNNSAQYPSWLQGTSAVQDKPQQTKQTDILTVPKVSAEPQLQKESSRNMPTVPSIATMDPTEGTLSGLRQQELFLGVALQMRQHEEDLSRVAQRQAILLQQQEQQLNELLSKQQQRQKRLDDVLTEQQMRITSYMQALSTEPVLKETSFFPQIEMRKNDAKNEDKEVQILPASKPEAEKWALEKKCLEETIQSLKIHHDQELQLLEESYKRQMSIMQKGRDYQEKYFKEENLQLKQNYEAQITSLKSEVLDIKAKYAEELADMQQKHLQEVQTLRQQHVEALEHLRNIRAAEIASLGEINSYSSLLNSSLEHLGQQSQDIGNLRNKVSEEHRALQQAKQAELDAKEKELQAMRTSLERQRAAADKEHLQLVGIVSQLEQQLSELRSNSQEQRLEMQQEKAHLEAREMALERERERFAAQLDREQRHIQHLRQSLLEEQQQNLQQLKDEQLKLSAEKSRIETLAQLHESRQSDVHKSQIEVQAAITTAQAATREAEAERSKLRDQQIQLEAERNRLRTLEEDLVTRAQQLESLSQAAAATKEEGLQALKEAKKLQDQNSKHLSEIQEKVADIHYREMQLSEEKMNLAQERLRLHRSNAPRLCPNCKMSAGLNSAENSLSMSLHDNLLVDPKLIMMKLIPEKDNVSSEERNILVSTLSSVHSASI